jgi:hypothetical protein
LGFGDYINDQNSEFRLNGVTVTGMGENEVVDRRVAENEPEE